MNELQESIIYDEKIYSFLKARISIQGEVVKELLRIISSKVGIYKGEILENTSYSDTSIRPVLNSLYVSGFVDIEAKGRLHIYYINSNGKKLLKDLLKI